MTPEEILEPFLSWPMADSYVHRTDALAAMQTYSAALVQEVDRLKAENDRLKDYKKRIQGEAASLMYTINEIPYQ